MAVILSIPSATYQAGERSFSFSPSAPAVEYRITLTREAWPVDAVAALDVSWGGQFAVSLGFTSGTTPLDRQGQPILTLALQVKKPAGVTSGSVRLTLSKALTTTVTVETL